MTDFEIMTLKRVQGDVLIVNVVSTSCRPDDYPGSFRHPCYFLIMPIQKNGWRLEMTRKFKSVIGSEMKCSPAWTDGQRKNLLIKLLINL